MSIRKGSSKKEKKCPEAQQSNNVQIPKESGITTSLDPTSGRRNIAITTTTAWLNAAELDSLASGTTTLG
jgi:hypothetical protein